MKNWLIGKLGGVSKEHYSALENKYSVLRRAHVKVYEQKHEAYKEADSYLIKIEQLEAEKAEMEKAAEMVSENLSETISRLNDEKRTSNGLMAKMTAQTQKIEELQAEIEAKNAELARVKSEIIAISKIKADTTLKAETQRLKAELELLKRRKGKK